jgi:6-pyruvoyltetrahydropterin/6-carboxytetrahydropterin synthase
MTTVIHSSKTFSDYPCAHRQFRHDGNCSLVHGYSRSFHFVFGAVTQDKCGFIVDFGDLDWLKGQLEHFFDHTLLLEANDPLLETFQELESKGACAIRLMPYGVGMEGTAQFLCESVDSSLRSRTKGRAWVVSVEARENPKNSAIYYNPEAGFDGWL